MKFEDLDIYEVGASIQIAGAVYADKARAYVLLFPDDQLKGLEIETINMTREQWSAFVRQTDLMETEVLAQSSDGSLAKMVLRKSTRQIDQRVSWEVYRRDKYTCCYCGRNDQPLTVDHLVTWETGGPTTVANLVTADFSCNAARGNLGYEEWLTHPYYLKVSKALTPERRAENVRLASTLGAIPRVIHKKSR